MSYPAIPDRRMPYDIDGTVVEYTVTGLDNFSEGPVSVMNGTDKGELNDQDMTEVTVLTSTTIPKLWMFFPEQREVTAIAIGYGAGLTETGTDYPIVLEGSDDSTNGVDGTWAEASWPNGKPAKFAPGSRPADAWRDEIKPCAFVGAVKVIRARCHVYIDGVGPRAHYFWFHVYGEKAAGETTDDLIFLDADDGSAEFTVDEDFGDRPLGTSVIRQFKVKNASSTKTANGINLQCNDSDMAISDSPSGPWVVSYDITSLAAGASSVTLYTRNTTPSPGALLGPRAPRIVAIVDSWS